MIKKYLERINGLPVPKRPGGYVYLDDVLNKLELVLKQPINHRLVQVIQEIKKNIWYLNSINHNPDVFATSERVKDAWDQVLPLIEHIFNDYEAKIKELDKRNDTLFTT